MTIHRQVTEMPEDWFPLLKEAAGKQSQAAFVRSLVEAGIRSKLKRRIKMSAMRGRGNQKAGEA